MRRLQAFSTSWRFLPQATYRSYFISIRFQGSLFRAKDLQATCTVLPRPIPSCCWIINFAKPKDTPKDTVSYYVIYYRQLQGLKDNLKMAVPRKREHNADSQRFSFPRFRTLQVGQAHHLVLPPHSWRTHSRKNTIAGVSRYLLGERILTARVRGHLLKVSSLYIRFDKALELLGPY
jgi:hypothetical protein